MDLLLQRLSSLNEDNEDEATAIYNALAVVENAIEVEPESTQAAATSAGLLDWLLNRLRVARKKGIDGNAQYASEILSVLLQAGEGARKKVEELEGVDVVLQAVAPFRNKYVVIYYSILYYI
jgi:beta-catenin-like protein 1